MVRKRFLNDVLGIKLIMGYDLQNGGVRASHVLYQDPIGALLTLQFQDIEGVDSASTRCTINVFSFFIERL